MTSKNHNRLRLGVRFSLRTLFVAMLLVGSGISWFVSQTRFAMRQQKAVEHIRQLGGNATFEYQMDSTRSSQPPPMPPSYLRKLTGNVVMSDVVKVSWHAPDAGAEDTEVLSDLSGLKDLRLNMRNLSDRGLRPVSAITRLRRLDLWCCQITDQALPHLAGLRELRQLDLYSTQVTDEGLRHLYELKNLEELNLRDTNVTQRGAARLQDVLPNCKISGVKGWPNRIAGNNAVRQQ